MVEKCYKCKSNVLPNECIKCLDCSVVCHTKCVGVVTRNKKWKCESCVLEGSSSHSKMSESDRDTANTSVLEAIAAFRSESSSRWDSNNVKLDKLQLDMNGIKTEIGDFKLRIDDVALKCAQAGEDMDSLKIENQQLNESISKLTLQVQDLEQHTRKNNLVISGVPLTNNENMFAILANMANILKTDFNENGVSAAHRLQWKKGDRRPPSIVVSFVSRQEKTLWLSARRSHGSLSAQELHRSFPDTPFYINEHLAPATKDIFNGARELRKQGKLTAVWTQDCKIMAKVSQEQRPFRITDLDHVARLGSGSSTRRQEPEQQPRPTSDQLDHVTRTNTSNTSVSNNVSTS